MKVLVEVMEVVVGVVTGVRHPSLRPRTQRRRLEPEMALAASRVH